MSPCWDHHLDIQYPWLIEEKRRIRDWVMVMGKPTAPHDDKRELDVYETGGCGYDHKQVKVTTVDGEAIEAFTYFALEIDHLQQPYHWYKEHVLRGALEHNFPSHYVDQIRATPSIDDHDQERHHRELSIYPQQS